MNSKQYRKLTRGFITEILKLLPAEYNLELTRKVLEQERRLRVLEAQLMRRDGYVIHEVEGGGTGEVTD